MCWINPSPRSANLSAEALAVENPESVLQIDRGLAALRPVCDDGRNSHGTGRRPEQRHVDGAGNEAHAGLCSGLRGRGGAHSEIPTGIWLSESFPYLPGLFWLGKLTGDASLIKLADEFSARVCELTQAATGLLAPFCERKIG